MRSKTLYKKIQVMLLLLCAIVFAHGQYSVMVSPYSGGSYGINDLALTSFVNSSGPLSMCYATIDCDVDGVGKVFTIRTKNFTLLQGASSLTYQQVVSADVVSSSQGYYTFSQTGKLPAGRYTICVSLYQIGSSNALASSCVQVNAISDGTLLLTTPYDEEILNTFLPNFGWSISNLPDDYNVTFNLKICELKEGQSYQDAIQYNPAIIFETGMKQNFYNYPAGAQQLKEDSRYVWQVEALVNNVPRYLSEVWMFRFKKSKSPPPVTRKVVTTQYPFLEKNLNTSPYIFKDAIVFRYKNECADTVLNYTLYQSGKTESIKLADKPVKLKAGLNYYSFPINKELLVTMKHNSKSQEPVFLLEVSNARKEKWRLKFVVRKK